MALTARIRAEIKAQLTSVLDQGVAAFPGNFDKIISLTSGTGANQADRLFMDSRQLAASANENIDLAAALTDALGLALTLVKVKAIAIYASPTNVNNVNVTRPASNGFAGLFLAAGDGVAIPPGGVAMFAAPAAAGFGSVVASTGDLINVANSGAGSVVDYEIVIIGTSA
jgi:hypothetical protein